MEACVLDRCLASDRCVWNRLGGRPNAIRVLASLRSIFFRFFVRFAGRSAGALDRDFPDIQERGLSEGATIYRARTGSLSTSNGSMNFCSSAELHTVIRLLPRANCIDSEPRPLTEEDA